MSIRGVFIAGLLGIVVTMPAQGRTVFGAGISGNCGEWGRLRLSAQQGRDSGQWKLYAVLHWVTGYLSGVNANSQGPDFVKQLGSAPADAVMGWLDNYCKANPLDNIVTAADALTDELQTRSRVEKQQ